MRDESKARISTNDGDIENIRIKFDKEIVYWQEFLIFVDSLYNQGVGRNK